MNSITGRAFRAAAEYVRLALEDAGAGYVDVVRSERGMAAMMRMMEGSAQAAVRAGRFSRRENS